MIDVLTKFDCVSNKPLPGNYVTNIQGKKNGYKNYN